LLAVLAWWLARRRTETPPPPAAPVLRPVWLLSGGVAIAAALIVPGLLTPDDERLSVTVLDVGQGDAILIETTEGQRLLVDGGPSGQAVAEALGDALPFSERTIDVVALTHADADHLTGLIDVLERFEVGQVVATPREADTGLFDAWREAVRREGAPYHEAQAGERIELDGGAAIDVLGPGEGMLLSEDANDASLVLMLTLGDISFLLTGDIEEGGEEAVLASGVDVRATVLKVAHHGSSGSTSPAFLDAVAPAIAIVSAGAKNPFGHPSPEVLQRLEGVAVLRTDERGNITISTDGERLWLETEQ
jgi:competence protein ComEC